MSDMQKNGSAGDPSLFNRVVSILDQARSNVVRVVNINMVMAYWLIGREIVQELQKGEERAEYGKQVLKQLSVQLSRTRGKGFRERYLKAALAQGLIEMTIPDRPRSRLQKYRLTDKGRQWSR